MIRTIACPDGGDLLALATEDVAAPAVRSHVDACRSCRRKVRRLKAEVVHLRASVAAEAGPVGATGASEISGPNTLPFFIHIAND